MTLLDRQLVHAYDLNALKIYRPELPFQARSIELLTVFQSGPKWRATYKDRGALTEACHRIAKTPGTRA